MTPGKIVWVSLVIILSIIVRDWLEIRVGNVMIGKALLHISVSIKCFADEFCAFGDMLMLKFPSK